MNPYNIIKEKRDGKKLSADELACIVDGYIAGSVPDYQMSAFLMAVLFRGLDFEETAELTRIYLDSGEQADLFDISAPKIDKHSTGGVGDKVSLVLAPLVASCGVYVPMLSGRGLGHTGGTLDKLESIPGYRTNLTLDEFEEQVRRIGVAITGQTETLVPADKKIYALRDVTATVESKPLICASIMSKKLAEGIDGLVLDVKVGSGSFTKTIEDALELAELLVQVGKQHNKKMSALLTNMSQPLGRFVGNALETVEARDFLKTGRAAQDLYDVTLALSSCALILGGIAKSYPEAKKILTQKLTDGSAYRKFIEMVEAQGGDAKKLEKLEEIHRARYIIEANSPKSGFVEDIDTELIGMFAVELGAGRKRLDDKIDPAVGFEILKKIGDYTKTGEPLLLIYANDKAKGEKIREKITYAYTISSIRQKTADTIFYIINEKGRTRWEQKGN